MVIEQVARGMMSNSTARSAVSGSPLSASLSSLQATRSSSMESLESSMSTTESTAGMSVGDRMTGVME